MELDFAKLNALAHTPPENPTKGHPEDLHGLASLQLQANTNKAAKEQALAVYREYQNNIKKSSQIQAEILSGLKAGESAYSLLLKACEAISLMTSNTLFYRQVNEDIRAVHGMGLLEPEPLAQELEKVQGRLDRLRESSKRILEPTDQQRIDKAIQQHELKVTELKSLIAQAQDKESLTA